MRSTRKKVIKTVYKDENDSEEETGDFSDSGSEAQISEHSSSEEDNEPIQSSSDEFTDKSKRSRTKATKSVKKTKFAKSFISKINQNSDSYNDDLEGTPTTLLSVKDLTEADKLLPSVLNLSESDSSDDESTKSHQKKSDALSLHTLYEKESCSDSDTKVEYKDVWSSNVQENSEEIANKAFQELEQHKNRIDKTKASIQSYELKNNQKRESNVNDLLALGEEVLEETKAKKTSKSRKKLHVSDSENEDWEEVKESKTIPPQGLQLIVDIPNACCRKKKAQDVEMMMKRKINRAKKEYQIYMHKVHVLCWLAHGNYVSCVINNQEILTAALSLVPSKDCYPKDRVDMKYVEQITQWYHEKMTIIQDKYENKFKPKAPPLKQLLLDQIKKRKASTKKYLVFIFVSMLRALGLQCRVMFNFVTLPIKPPSSELCSLSTKPKSEKTSDKVNKQSSKIEKPIKDKVKKKTNTNKSKKIPQVDGNDDISFSSDCENIMQVDGNDDSQEKSRSVRTRARKAKEDKNDNTDVSPPKKVRKSPNTKTNTVKKPVNKKEKMNSESALNNNKNKSQKDLIRSRHFADIKTLESDTTSNSDSTKNIHTSNNTKKTTKFLQTRSPNNIVKNENSTDKNSEYNVPKIEITNEDNTSSKYFHSQEATGNKNKLTLKRKRSTTANPSTSSNKSEVKVKQSPRKTRTKSAPGNFVDKSEYFTEKGQNSKTSKINQTTTSNIKSQEKNQRVSHRDLIAKSKVTAKNDVTSDLIGIIKNRVREAKTEAKRGVVKGKQREASDDDSDYLSEEPVKHYKSDDEDFKPTKISPRPSTSRKPIDRRVLSSDEETPKNKSDVWCEIFVEELEQWISVDVVNAKVHCTSALYSHSTHPVCYIVGWDNNNKLKDLTRRYVPHWNTVTRKQRAETQWWNKAILPWLGPKNARDKEEDVQLDRMQLEAPMPKSISEYKNHPLYVLKRHLLKFEAIYPPDAATLGFVRNDPVYARECVYVCRSRDTWLKEAKVVKLGEKPYKIVKARPKWDKLSNKLITDKMLEVFGPWQVQDYEPPVAENGVVPRNAYGNVELFKACMLPKGTVHIKLPGLNKVARKLNIDCAPAMTGFDFNGGWSHPVFDGFVVCQEFEEVITEAWLKDQEEQERKEREKTEARVYGNWKRLIKGLLIRERLKNKYGFEEPSTSSNKTQKSKGPRLVVKKKS